VRGALAEVPASKADSTRRARDLTVPARASRPATTTAGAPRSCILAGTLAAHAAITRRRVRNYLESLELRRRAGERGARLRPCRTWAWWPSTRATSARPVVHERALTLRTSIATGGRSQVSNTNLALISLLQGAPGRCPCRVRGGMRLNLEVGDTWMVAISHKQPRQRLRDLGEQGAAARSLRGSGATVLGERRQMGHSRSCSKMWRCASPGWDGPSPPRTDRRRGPVPRRGRLAASRSARSRSRRSPGVRGGRRSRRGPLGAQRGNRANARHGCRRGVLFGPVPDHDGRIGAPDRRAPTVAPGNPVAFFHAGTIVAGVHGMTDGTKRVDARRTIRRRVMPRSSVVRWLPSGGPSSAPCDHGGLRRRATVAITLTPIAGHVRLGRRSVDQLRCAGLPRRVSAGTSPICTDSVAGPDYGLLKFDLSSIPAGAVVTGAAYDDHARRLRAERRSEPSRDQLVALGKSPRGGAEHRCCRARRLEVRMSCPGRRSSDHRPVRVRRPAPICPGERRSRSRSCRPALITVYGS